MASSSKSKEDENRSSLMDSIQSDLKNVSLESRKKYPSVKEATEEAIVKIRTGTTTTSDLSSSILYPLVRGCETKDSKIVRLCLNLMQKLVVHNVVTSQDFKAGRLIADTLWMLMENGVEEVKILQTVTLLLTSTRVVQNETLSRCLVVCFRLRFTKDPAINTLAGATIRQLVPVVFERIGTLENGAIPVEIPPLYRKLLPMSSTSSTLDPFVADACLLFQDVTLLVSGENPLWLVGIVEMTRTFGLELMESLLTKFSPVFKSNEVFRFLLKDKVCSLVIKLFSPSEKPHYSITSKLLRVVSVLILEYHDVLTTETEIFLSLITKFLDPDKVPWQNCIALEVIHKILIDPELLTFLCRRFDLQDHSTKVFQDMINGLGAYVQTVMTTTSETSENETNPSNNAVLYGPGVTPQPGFYYRSVWKPLTMSFIGGQTKETYLEMSEKTDPPVVSDGYGISLAYVSLLDSVRSLSLIIDQENVETTSPVHNRLIESSWCGVLASLSLLLDASTDDSTTETILKSLQTYASLCGVLRMFKPRDAFLAAMCKASLPPHYTLNVLKSTASTQTVSSHSSMENDLRHQVVAVGTPLPTSSLPVSAHQGPVMLTSKNLQCMRAILSVAHCLGNLLGSSWHIILTSIQHLVWILGLKPVSNGISHSAASNGNVSTSATTSGSETSSAVITTAVMADLPVLSNMVTRLFESSCDLTNESVEYLITALCTLSEESMELANHNREPSLFAVAKLLETGLVNLNRLDVIWRPITIHLLIVCQHPHLKMRQWGCEALTFLAKQALQRRTGNQTLLLSPLAELCVIPYPDVRQRQLDTVLQILHSSGEVLDDSGWPVVLNIIGNLEDNDILVRNAFQCLQLVFADFLPTLPHRCYPICVETAAKFGSQTAEMNVSLTAIGLLWNLSDYFFQNVQVLRNDGEITTYVFPADFAKDMPSFDKLWMWLYCKLKNLCLDGRPSVRKSAGQTLFSTIAAHGSVLKTDTWRSVFWQVLFPLLEEVLVRSDKASTEKSDESIMIHHSRNTAQKQWAETKVLSISGVVRVFNSKTPLLKSLGNYSKAWTVLLDYVEKMGLCETMEVSLAALKALHEMINESNDVDDNHREYYEQCWKSWLNISNTRIKYVLQTQDTSLHCQILLNGLIQIFGTLFRHLKKHFKRSDIKNLGATLIQCIQVPVELDSSSSSDCLTSVHKSVICDAIKIVKGHAVESAPQNVPEIFEILFRMLEICIDESRSNRFKVKLGLLGDACMRTMAELYEQTCSNPYVMKEKVLHKILSSLSVALKKSAKFKTRRRVAIGMLIGMLKRGIPIIRCGDETNCDETFWIDLSETIDAFLFQDSNNNNNKDDDDDDNDEGEEEEEEDEEDEQEEEKKEKREKKNEDGDEKNKKKKKWKKKKKTEKTNTNEDSILDEAIDCELVELLKDEILPYSGSIPGDFIRKMVILLNKGSIHTTVKLSKDCSANIGLREEFAQRCFETLLEFSLLETDDSVELSSSSSSSTSSSSETSLTNKMAITALLIRFKEVLTEAIQQLSGATLPMQRQKTTEMTFVLKALASVIASVKRTTNKVDKRTWKQIIGLYPLLVQCTGSTDFQIRAAVKAALMEYNELLKPL